jgi:hypothetical protein
MVRSKSDRLNNAKDRGATIKSKGGEKVTYDSRGPRDDKPWKDSKGNRYSGPECEATVE